MAPARTSSCVALSSLLITLSGQCPEEIDFSALAKARQDKDVRNAYGNPSADECSNPRAICRNANRPRFKLMFIVRNKHRIIHKFTYFNVDGFLISFVLC